MNLHLKQIISISFFFKLAKFHPTPAPPLPKKKKLMGKAQSWKPFPKCENLPIFSFYATNFYFEFYFSHHFSQNIDSETREEGGGVVFFSTKKEKENKLYGRKLLNMQINKCSLKSLRPGGGRGGLHPSKGPCKADPTKHEPNSGEAHGRGLRALPNIQIALGIHFLKIFSSDTQHSFGHY